MTDEDDLMYFEHTCRGQCADWCIGCIDYLYQHPRARAHIMWDYYIVIVNNAWVIETTSLHHAVEFAVTYYSAAEATIQACQTDY